MCALQAQQELQQDHDILATARLITVNEISVFYRYYDHRFELSLDPGLVKALFWDEVCLNRYLKAPWHTMHAIELQPDASPHGTEQLPFKAEQTADTLAYGVYGRLFWELNDGRMCITHDEVVTTHLVARYTSQGVDYELPLPTNIHDANRRATPDRPLGGGPGIDAQLKAVGMGSFTGAQVDNGVDVLFWDRHVCEDYRREFQKQNVLNPHILLAADGSTHGKQLRGVIAAHNQALFMPRPAQRTARYHSKTCTLCYHYESCQWACTVDAP